MRFQRHAAKGIPQRTDSTHHFQVARFFRLFSGDEEWSKVTGFRRSLRLPKPGRAETSTVRWNKIHGSGVQYWCVPYEGPNNMVLNQPDHEWKKGSAELLVLSLLEDQPRHGYDISKLILIRSGGILQFFTSPPFIRCCTGSRIGAGSQAVGWKRPSSEEGVITA